jgi:Pyocin activator protein PrtN
VNSTFVESLAEFGEAGIPLHRVAAKYFSSTYNRARRLAPAKMLPQPVFGLGGQKSRWLVSAAELAALIDPQRAEAGGDVGGGLR